MKTRTKILTPALALFTVLTVITACKKDSSNSTSNTNTTAASGFSSNGAVSDNGYEDVFNIAMQVGGNESEVNRLMQRGGGVTTLSGNGTAGAPYYCAAVTVTGAAFPITVTVDFGSGCASADNITRSGSITYVFTGRLHTPGTVISATFNNYSVNGYKLTGAYSMTNSSTNNIFSMTYAVTDGSITYPNDSTYGFTGSKKVTLVSGDSVDISTFIFNVTGGYTITNAHTGESLTATITTPLVKKLSCPYAVSGLTTFVYTKGTGSISGSLDYGNGTCDAVATITIGAFIKVVNLY